MKTRQGFVSNSSSSSFIVSAKETDELKFKVQIEVDLKDYVTNIIHTKAQLDDLFEQNEWDKNDDYNSAQTALDRGEAVYFGRIRTDDLNGEYLVSGIKKHSGDKINVIQDTDY